MGRLYGGLPKVVFGNYIALVGYPVVGAAGFNAGETRALSVAIVIFKLQNN